MSYRPKNWHELKVKATMALLKRIKPRRKPTGEEWLEAGADALLEVLKAEGVYIMREQIENFAQGFNLEDIADFLAEKKGQRGWLFFLTDEEVKGE